MCKAFFARKPGIRVRQRFFTTAEGLRRWCREVALLAEPVLLVIASHGRNDGLDVGGGPIPLETIAHGLRCVPHVRLLHFSACKTMNGKPAELFARTMDEGLSFPISGYTTAVDWGASALIEFLYLRPHPLARPGTRPRGRTAPSSPAFRGSEETRRSHPRGRGLHVHPAALSCYHAGTMKPSIRELGELLASDDVELRRYAVETLGAQEGPEADALLTRARSDPELAVRILAKRFLKARNIPFEASSTDLPSPEELAAVLATRTAAADDHARDGKLPAGIGRPSGRPRHPATPHRGAPRRTRVPHGRRAEASEPAPGRPKRASAPSTSDRSSCGPASSTDATPRTLLGATFVVHLPVLFLLALVALLALSPADRNVRDLLADLELMRIPLHLLAILLAEAVVAKIAADELDGDLPRIGRSLFFCYDRSSTILSALLVKGLLLGAGSALAIVLLLCPGAALKGAGLLIGAVTAYGFLLWGFVTIAATLENVRGYDACRRSANLVARNPRKVFNLVFLLAIAMALVTAASSLPAHALGRFLAAELGRPPLAEATVQLVETAVNVICHPYIVLAMTLLYFDFLVRTEGRSS